MLGGITAWIEAGYPIYTTYHHVTVDVVVNHVSTNIEPLLLYPTSYTSCGCQPCAQNQNINVPLNINITTIRHNENTTMTLMTYEVNDAISEVIVTQTLLWSYNETTGKTNRTVMFVSLEIAAKETSMRLYSLNNIVQHEGYNLTLYTVLRTLNSKVYNNSFTVINFVPTGKSMISMEFIEFNSPLHYRNIMLS